MKTLKNLFLDELKHDEALWGCEEKHPGPTIALTSASRSKESTSKRNRLNPHQRILVVDDDEDLRRLNTELLANSGYRVDAAPDGALAWDSLRNNSYDLLLTDHDMPKMSGRDLIKKLRAARVVMPVILVSGTTIPLKELRQDPWLQIDATLSKPYTSDELLATVRKVLYDEDVCLGTV